MLGPLQYLTSKKLSVANQLPDFRRSFRLIWDAAPVWTAAWIVLLVIQGLLPAVSVYLTRSLVDGLVLATRTSGSWSHVQPVLVVIGLLVGVSILTEVLHSASTWLRTAQSEHVQDHIRALTHQKAMSVDLAFYECPDYHDRLHRVMSECSSRPVALLESAGSLLQGGLTLLAMTAILTRYGVWMPMALIVSSLPALAAVVVNSRRHHQWWERTTPERRRAQYYDMMLTHGQTAPEVRVFSLGPYFQTAYQAIRYRLRLQRLELVQREGLVRFAAGLSALLAVGAAMVWMLSRALAGQVTLGDLALFYQAFTNGQNLMRSLLGSVGQIYGNSLFLVSLFAFLDLRPQVTVPKRPASLPTRLEKGIEFRHVTFQYPGADRPALDSFSLWIPSGKIVAIVGPNGAGKSTLLKLLCRFYDPQSGAVEFDGIDLRNVSAEEVRRRVAVLFQSPVLFQDTVAQNIAMGDLSQAQDLSTIKEAARAAGAHEFVTALPEGYGTLLGKMFAGGVELSGGQWQRIAQARAFLRRAPILLLDEPTSFMDSWGEAEWFDRVRTLARGCTTIIITHRFTIARRADIIYVMKDGQVVESGGHDELVTLSGLYGQSWQEQVHSVRSPVACEIS